MPELPEVETITRGLKKQLVGQKITRVDVLNEGTIEFDLRLITEVITEQKISAIWRRAKVLIWDLSSGYSLLFHLKMTGQFVLRNAQSQTFSGGHPTASMQDDSDLPDSSTRVIFSLEDGSRLYFNDQRKFGWIRLLPTAEVHSDKFLSSVGPEHDSQSFTPKYLWDKIKNRITPIKALLLDQKIVAGIGNIYADEALHLAKIHPARKASSLSKAETAVLFNAVLSVLADGIKYGGTSFDKYVNAQGEPGNYIKHARVFKREGQTCRVCGDTIIKTRVAGRGTHYCPTCQPKPKGFN